MTAAPFDVLQVSSTRLRAVVGGLDADQLGGTSYATEWTIADVLSHLGAGAVIMRARPDAALDATPLPNAFSQSVWDQWNAKSPEAKATDALETDRALVAHLGEVPDERAAALRFAFGPIDVDWATFVAFRRNEHALRRHRT